LEHLDHVLAARHNLSKCLKMLTSVVNETDSHSTARQYHRSARFVRVLREVIQDRIEPFPRIRGQSPAIAGWGSFVRVVCRRRAEAVRLIAGTSSWFRHDHPHANR